MIKSSIGLLSYDDFVGNKVTPDVFTSALPKHHHRPG
jgi:hypothetical protein